MTRYKLISKKITPFTTCKLFIPLTIICAIILTGVLGFMIIEGFNLLDALYMTIVTITTVGYEEVHELSKAGMIFNMFLIISSFSTLAFALTKLTQYVVD